MSILKVAMENVHLLASIYERRAQEALSEKEKISEDDILNLHIELNTSFKGVSIDISNT